MAQKSTLYRSQKLVECQKLAESFGGRCLSNEYVDCYSPMLWQCGKCNYRWEVAWHSVKSGRWCKCGKRRIRSKKFNIEAMHDIARRHGGVCLAKEYSDNVTALPWQCSKGHQFWSRPSHVKGGRWCGKCRMRAHSDRCHAANLAKARGIIKAKSGKLLQVDERDRKVLYIRCNDGHECSVTMYALFKGSWCKYCRKLERIRFRHAISQPGAVFDDLIEFIDKKAG